MKNKSNVKRLCQILYIIKKEKCIKDAKTNESDSVTTASLMMFDPTH